MPLKSNLFRVSSRLLLFETLEISREKQAKRTCAMGLLKTSTGVLWVRNELEKSSFNASRRLVSICTVYSYVNGIRLSIARSLFYFPSSET